MWLDAQLGGLTGIGDQWDLIDVVAARGVSVESLRARLKSVIPDDGTSVITSTNSSPP